VALYQGAEPGLDVGQPGGHQGAVSIVQPTAPVRCGGTLGPPTGQCAFGIAPTDECLKALEVERMAHFATEGTALFVNAGDARNASLPFVRSPFQGFNIVSLEVTVLAIEKDREFVQSDTLLRKKTSESLAALCLVHLDLR
jgi:hypothetical protein